MTVEAGRRGRSSAIPWLLLGGAALAGLAILVGFSIALNRGPGWEASATNRPDGVLVEAFVGAAVEPNFSVVLEGRSIPRDVQRATPETFDPEIFRSSYRDPTISPGYWAFEIDGVPIGVVRSWMRVGDLTGDDLVIERGETVRYPKMEEPAAAP